MTGSPTVVEVLAVEPVVPPANGSRRAIVRWSDGSVSEALRWYDDEILVSEGDLLGRTEAQLRALHFERDRHFLLPADDDLSSSQPFTIVTNESGGKELRAFSDDSDDPIVVPLNAQGARELSIALGEALLDVDDPDVPLPSVRAAWVGGRRLEIVATRDGLRLSVERPSAG